MNAVAPAPEISTNVGVVLESVISSSGDEQDSSAERLSPEPIRRAELRYASGARQLPGSRRCTPSPQGWGARRAALTLGESNAAICVAAASNSCGAPVSLLLSTARGA